jgi:hypothetical protein
VWQLERRTGGLFSDENSQGRQPAVQFLDAGEMRMHNWRGVFAGRYKLDSSAAPARLEMNWTSDKVLDSFDVEFPDGQTMLLKAKTAILSIDAEGTTRQSPGQETLHFRRLADPPPPLSAERIRQIEALMSKLDELRSSPADATLTATTVSAQVQKLEAEIERLKTP